MFGLDEIGSNVDEVIEGDEGGGVLGFFALVERPFIIIIVEKYLFWAGHSMEFQGHFYILLHPLVLGYNGAGGLIIWLKINVGYILQINLHDIEYGVSLNCDGFSVVPGVDHYFPLLIFLHFFCFEVYLFFFFI